MAMSIITWFRRRDDGALTTALEGMRSCPSPPDPQPAVRRRAAGSVHAQGTVLHSGDELTPAMTAWTAGPDLPWVHTEHWSA